MMEPLVKKFNAGTSYNNDKDQSINLIRLVDNDNSIKQDICQNVLTYDVLRIIFKYLSARDLCKVATICRHWQDAAINEMNTRRGPEHILKSFQIVNKDDSNDLYSATNIGKDLRIKPSLGLICVRVQEENEWTPKGCYCKNLPKKCSAIIFGGYDIVANDAKIEDKCGIASCAFLPEISQLKHKIFRVDKHTFKGVAYVDINAHAEKLIKQLLPSKNERSKCVIMLANQEGYHFTKIMMKGLQKRYKPGTLSLWGGVCVDLKLCDATKSTRTCSQPARWAAFTLSSPFLQSWSTVLLRSCRTEVQIQEKLENLKKNIQLKKYSLGLMFACCERMHRKATEIAVFKKVFPKIPLIGLHGDGEYGLNTLSEKRENHLQHAYSTIFLILTYQ